MLTRRAMLLTGAAAALVAPGTPAPAMATPLPPFPVMPPPMPIWQVGTPGEMNWRFIAAETFERAKQLWAIEESVDEGEEPELNGEDVTKHATFTVFTEGDVGFDAPLMQTMGWSTHCDRCGGEPSDGEWHEVKGPAGPDGIQPAENVCVYCLTRDELAVFEPERYAGMLADEEDDGA